MSSAHMPVKSPGANAIGATDRTSSHFRQQVVFGDVIGDQRTRDGSVDNAAGGRRRHASPLSLAVSRKHGLVLMTDAERIISVFDLPHLHWRQPRSIDKLL